MTAVAPSSLPAPHRPVIAGIGFSPIGKVFGADAPAFAATAVRAAATDAGLPLSRIDGLLISSGVGTPVTVALQQQLGLRDLRLLTQMQAYGSTAAQMIQYASMAIAFGMADTIAVVWADDPLTPNRSTGAAYSARSAASGWRAMSRSAGITGPNVLYALAARRHMTAYGTTTEAFGHIAVAQRDWAARNPMAQLREPISLADHEASRLIADPLRLLDCCLVSNGAVALIVTTAERAADLPQTPVGVAGWGQAHPGTARIRDDRFGLTTGAATSGPAALQMADLTLDEIDVVELYDCYTYTVLVTLEDYGFCAKGEGAAFVSEPGRLGPGGSLALNTGGGQLSGYYMWGMTPVSEAILQLRGHGGERQVSDAHAALVSTNGGTLDHHGTLVLVRED